MTTTKNTTAPRLRKGRTYTVSASGAGAYGTRRMTYLGIFNGCAAFRPLGLSDTFFCPPGSFTATTRTGSTVVGPSSLFDSETGRYIGPATPEQISASAHEATGTGHILIDDDGDVIAEGSWDAQQAGVRKVYVA